MIVAEMETRIPALSVGEAVMQMELAGSPVLVFKNEKQENGINIVYRREDGNIGWIDPTTENLSRGAFRAKNQAYMTVAKLLTPESIRVVSGLTSKKRLFQSLGEMSHNIHGLSTELVVEALMERESLGPTGVGQGVALPHARLSQVDRVKGVFMRLERPLDFGAVDRQPVDLFFCLFAPLDAGVDHLKALATVSRTLRDSDLCAKLRANSEPATLYTLLTEFHESRAA